MAEAMRDAYQDLFRVKTDAHTMSRSDLKNKLKTLSQGTLKESVQDKMAMTFNALAGYSDFSASPPAKEQPSEDEGPGPEKNRKELPPDPKKAIFGGLHYNIQIILPSTRDTKVYDAIFKSLKDHLSD